MMPFGQHHPRGAGTTSSRCGLPSGSPYSYALQPDLQAVVGASGSSPASTSPRGLPSGSPYSYALQLDLQAIVGASGSSPASSLAARTTSPFLAARAAFQQPLQLRATSAERKRLHHGAALPPGKSQITLSLMTFCQSVSLKTDN